MKEIIGDDYPTYEDSVNMTLAERKDFIPKRQISLEEENLVLKHRLACITDDIKLIARHIENNCDEIFKQPSLNEDGSVYADEAWHNISNIEIACDLDRNDALTWGSEAKDGNLEFLDRDRYFRKKAKEIEAIQNKVNKL
jgi:hypothetical protein